MNLYIYIFTVSWLKKNYSNKLTFDKILIDRGALVRPHTGMHVFTPEANQ